MKKTNYKLTHDEQDLLESFERGEWKSVKNMKAKRKSAQKIAANTMKQWEKSDRAHKDARINIRLTSSDLDSIKKIADHEGLPYQTLIASVLHKLATGRLKNAA